MRATWVVLCLAACGGGDASAPDAMAPVDGGRPDARPGANAMTVDGVDVDLPYVEAYLYTFGDLHQLRFNASTDRDFDCFGSSGCTSLYVTLPADVAVGAVTCAQAPVQVIVQRDDAYFASDVVSGTPGGPTPSCMFTLDARGPVGAAHRLSGLTATLLQADAEVPALQVTGGMLDVVRGDDVLAR